MKITIEIDCTPDEARETLGIPDVKPMQEAMMGDIEERMRSAMQSMDAETLVKTWMPANIQGLETLQKAFWSQMTSGLGKTPPSD